MLISLFPNFHSLPKKDNFQVINSLQKVNFQVNNFNFFTQLFFSLMFLME
jgi:hypothetical protein